MASCVLSAFVDSLVITSAMGQYKGRLDMDDLCKSRLSKLM